jgi:hypothetical protein
MGLSERQDKGSDVCYRKRLELLIVKYRQITGISDESARKRPLDIVQ